MWIFPWIKLSWHSCFMWDKVGWLKWFWQFLPERLSSFNPKGFCYSYSWSCSLCEGRTSSCTGLTSRKLCRFLFMFWTGFTSFHVLLLLIFFCLYAVFDAILSSIAEGLSISLPANVLVFGHFNVHHKDWLTYPGGTDRPGELCYNLSWWNRSTWWTLL